MKKLAVIVGAVGFFGMADAALAQSSGADEDTKWYVGVFGGLNYTHDGAANGGGDTVVYDLGHGLGAYGGFRFNRNLRVEVELSHRSNAVDTVNGLPFTADLSTTALMGNIFYDISPGNSLNPHVGVGIGFADATYEYGGLEYTDTVLALQLGVGIDFAITETVAITADYRLFITDDMELGAGTGFGSVEYVNSSLLAGLRLNF